MKAQGTPLKDARIVFYGAGSSAVGVATMIAQLLVKEAGLTFEEAKKVPYSCLRDPCFAGARMRLSCAPCLPQSIQCSLSTRSVGP